MKVYTVAHMDEDDYNLNTDSVFETRERAEERLTMLEEDHKGHVDEDGNEVIRDGDELQCCKCLQLWVISEMEVQK